MLRLLNRLDLLFKVEDLIYHYCSRSSFFRSGAFNCVSACVERERERDGCRHFRVCFNDTDN